MIVGLLRADGGRIFLEGREVTDLPMYKRCRLGMGYLPQESSVFRKLTVEENLLAILETLDLSHHERHARLEELLAELDLTPLASHRAYRSLPWPPRSISGRSSPFDATQAAIHDATHASLTHASFSPRHPAGCDDPAPPAGHPAPAAVHARARAGRAQGAGGEPAPRGAARREAGGGRRGGHGHRRGRNGTRPRA